MRIGVVGINGKAAGVHLRELMALACLHHFEKGSSSTAQETFVSLSTCNRTEIYFHSFDLAHTHSNILEILRTFVREEFDQKLYSFFGRDCLQHLSRVTAGLDSAIVAETEIQGQVKTAYEKAREIQALPEELHYLFQKALKIGKQVRSKLSIQRGLPSLEHAILYAGQNHFKRSDTKILFVGASEINRKILEFLQAKQFENISICNRTAFRANELAKTYNCKILEWENLNQNWHSYDWIIVGTKAPTPIIHAKAEHSTQKLLIDLSVPRNIDLQLAQDPLITLLNIDDLNQFLSVRKQQIQHLLSAAESLTESASDRYASLYYSRQTKREKWLTAV